MKVLATDLDRTLLPNGRWDPEEGAIARFNQLTEASDLVVVYVTGRSLTSTEEAIAKYGIRYPHVLCADVGTSIYRYKEDTWIADDGWPSWVMKGSPKWDAEAVARMLASVTDVQLQEPTCQRLFKRSFYVDHGRQATIVDSVRALTGGRFDEVLVYSYDESADVGLLDILPKTATKQTSLAYVADASGCSHSQVVFCGDSGNDILPLTASFLGVLVGNADEQLVEKVQEAERKMPSLQVYYAQKYYTAGVIEGAKYYGHL
ncbi:MAG: HAD family hydrolase [Myxococcales bacterium]|nr:HAD family hydrolase [Myxococcales bacterium]